MRYVPSPHLYPCSSIRTPYLYQPPVVVGFILTDPGPLARENVPREVRHLG